jgi:hypothetical protein
MDLALLMASKVGVFTAAIALAFVVQGDSTSPISRGVCLLLSAAIAVQGLVVLRLRLISSDVTLNRVIVFTLLFEGTVLALAGFLGFYSRLRYLCLAIAATVPVILMVIRGYE